MAKTTLTSRATAARPRWDSANSEESRSGRSRCARALGRATKFSYISSDDKMNWSEFLTQVLPGLGTALLAIISGAGGSALLELFWKPRQERRKVATTLMADILLNTELLLLQAHARVRNPKGIPDDFNLSLMGWDATSESLRELPAELIKSLVLLYNRYRYLNSTAQNFGKSLDQYESLPDTDPRKQRLQRNLDVYIDVFNTSLDKAIENGKTTLPQLLILSGVKERAEAEAKLRDYAKDVEKLLSDREERIRRLNSA